ncbi:histidine phosphatase family protein [Candidatus Shapirobacteria bacterium]|nr:histidine phosphatase family protein [Candidatus Shapirobacteria bacterium]
MKIILVRHGEAGKNLGLMMPGEKENLTAKGVKQAVELAAELAGTKIGAIYCSPTLRCQQTLDEILRIRDDNMPIHLTSIVGPKLKKEKYTQLQHRIEIFLDDLKNDHEKDETVLVISHLRPIEMMTWLVNKEKTRLENGMKTELDLRFTK